MTEFEIDLAGLVLKTESLLRKQNNPLADPVRMHLYWLTIEAQARGTNAAALVQRMKETLLDEG